MTSKKDISKEFEKISEGVEKARKKRKSLTGKIFKWMCLAVGGSLLIVAIFYHNLRRAREFPAQRWLVRDSA